MLQPLFDNTMANVLAAIVMLIIGAALGWISRVLVERKPVRQLLNLSELNGAIIVLATPYFVIPGTTNISQIRNSILRVISLKSSLTGIYS